MEASQRRKLNQAQAESAFIKANQADFPSGSPGGKTAQTLDERIAEFQTVAGEQDSQARRASVNIKNDLFEELEVSMQKINRAAVALEYEIPGIRDTFRMPRNRSENARLAAARNFYTSAEPYQTQFEDYDLPADFRQEIMTIIAEIEAAQTAADTGAEQTGGATGALAEIVREMSRLMTKLDAVVKNKYYADAQKLAAWAIASHLEAAPQRTSVPPPSAPTARK